MKIPDILFAKNSFHCITCRGRFPKRYAFLAEGGLCICEECYDRVTKYRSPSSFEGSRYLKFLLSAFPYGGILREAFVDFKFHSQRAYYMIFARLLSEYAENFIKKEDFDLIVPVPLSDERMYERGFNQSELLAEGLSLHFGIANSANALFRTRNTDRQSSLSRSQRAKNVMGAFIADKSVTAGKRILLLDDIFTMGATMNECAHTLLIGEAESVAGITLFKSNIPHDKSVEYEFPKPVR